MPASTSTSSRTRTCTSTSVLKLARCGLCYLPAIQPKACLSAAAGDDIIKQFGFSDKGSIEQNCGILFGIMWGFLIMAYIMLWVNVRRMVSSN